MMLSKTKIMVCDDNQDISILIALHLQNEPYHVVTQNNGRSALNELNTVKFDLILLDIMMPGMTGFEVLNELKNVRIVENRTIPVIMITAKSGMEDIEKSLSLGATSYIVKPFTGNLLKEKISEVIMRASENNNMMRKNSSS